MDFIVFGELTVKKLLVFAGIAAGLFVILSVIKGVFRKKDGNRHFQFVECQNCAWQGNVSRYVGHCPKCNMPLGDLKARRNL